MKHDSGVDELDKISLPADTRSKPTGDANQTLFQRRASVSDAGPSLKQCLAGVYRWPPQRDSRGLCPSLFQSVHLSIFGGNRNRPQRDPGFRRLHWVNAGLMLAYCLPNIKPALGGHLRLAKSGFGQRQPAFFLFISALQWSLVQHKTAGRIQPHPPPPSIPPLFWSMLFLAVWMLKFLDPSYLPSFLFILRCELRQQVKMNKKSSLYEMSKIIYFKWVNLLIVRDYNILIFFVVIWSCDCIAITSLKKWRKMWLFMKNKHL